MHFSQPVKRGFCYICGKSTKLNIHQDCSKEAEKRLKKDKRQKPEKVRANYGKEAPPFCYWGS